MNPVNRLLIIDDDHGLVNLLKRFLEGEGFHVDAAYDQASGLSAALSNDHELIILDVMLPGGTGFELLKALRLQSSVPVLLLTARGEAVDRILGLEIGAAHESIQSECQRHAEGYASINHGGPYWTVQERIPRSPGTGGATGQPQ